MDIGAQLLKLGVLFLKRKDVPAPGVVQRRFFHIAPSIFLPDGGADGKCLPPGTVVLDENGSAVPCLFRRRHQEGIGKTAEVPLLLQKVKDRLLVHAAVTRFIVSRSVRQFSLARKVTVGIDRHRKPVIRRWIVEFHFLKSAALKRPEHLGAGEIRLVLPVGASRQIAQSKAVLAGQNERAVLRQEGAAPLHGRRSRSPLFHAADHHQVESPGRIFQPVGDIGATAVSPAVHLQIFIALIQNRHMGGALCQQTGQGSISGSDLQHLLRAVKRIPLQEILADIGERVEILRSFFRRQRAADSLRIAPICFK